jgi:DNA (cytosine-5)-methyltransferase 1
MNEPKPIQEAQWIKVLNLYAGIGGNRKLWPENVEVTAVEIEPKIAEIYQKFFPQDKVIVADAHQYLLDHYKEFDFIWSSPPCQSHSRTNIFLNAQGIIRYPDMRLYEEIIFLKQWFKGKWAIENVIPYYKPLISPTISNFPIASTKESRTWNICNSRQSSRRPSKDYKDGLKKYHGFDIDDLTLLRNCVNPKLGLHVFNCAFREKQERLL